MQYSKPVIWDQILFLFQSKANIFHFPFFRCWNCPYSTLSFPEYAETVPNVGGVPDHELSPSITMLCDQARELGVWIVGGSVPEREVRVPASRDFLYNTCIVVNPSGEIVGKHRKMHLFDIDVPGRIKFKESDSLSPGNSVTVIDTPWGGVGIGICYDIRFPELAMLMRKKGAKLFIYPGAFNMVTGPAHWELLQRARAVDNQVFVATCSPSRDESSNYIAWGHSTIVSPWGDIIAKAGPEEEIITCEIELKLVDEMRQNIPCWSQKRVDIYNLEEIVEETN